MTITDKQAIIIGREAGRVFAALFWEKVQDDNEDRYTAGPAAWFLKVLGWAIGKEIAKVYKA